MQAIFGSVPLLLSPAFAYCYKIYVLNHCPEASLSHKQMVPYASTPPQDTRCQPTIGEVNQRATHDSFTCGSPDPAQYGIVFVPLGEVSRPVSVPCNTG